MIYGESGVGKELVARALHEKSSRRGEPFVAVNCSAISAEIFESELFGHEKGSFTGADERKDGKFLIANGGTIFLDETSRNQNVPNFAKLGLNRVRNSQKVLAITGREGL